ncbi:hypothetical protein [Halalkalicoccus tibetensis]|uniref:Uncharacterized protein n=1 Tax=Halalkalicoccus tibetensis TaxID=175632 RepID=A0ABD5VDX5_9EURY
MLESLSRRGSNTGEAVGGFHQRGEIGGPRIGFLDLTRQVELAEVGIQVEIFPVERDEFTNVEPNVCEENDECLIPILEVGCE